MSNAKSFDLDHVPLADKHRGMRVSASGMLKQAANAARQHDGATAEMLRQLSEHLVELGQRFYAGDLGVVDEFLQLYCVAPEARATLCAAREAADAGETPAPSKDLPKDVPQDAGQVDPDCVCRGNWRRIVSREEKRLGERFVDEHGVEHVFFGIVHGDDDYYYGLQSTGRQLVLLSCVGSIEFYGLTPVSGVRLTSDDDNQTEDETVDETAVASDVSAGVASGAENADEVVLEPDLTKATLIDRGEAVNLARNCLEHHDCKGVTPRGVRILSEAVMRMDEALSAARRAQAS